MNHYGQLLLGETQYESLNEFDSGGGDDDGGSDDGGSEGLVIDLPSSYFDLKTFNNYVFCKMSGIELSYHIIMFFLLIFAILLSVAIPSTFTFLQSATEIFFTIGLTTLIITAYYYEQGWISDTELAENIAGVMHGSLEALVSALNSAPFGEILLIWIYCGCSAALLLADAFTAGATTIIRIVAAAASIIMYTVEFICDMLDEDILAG
ncbi:MAG: hypothetical protein HZR80_04180 [Candidatus Heimdallarchaeota archaeon]